MCQRLAKTLMYPVVALLLGVWFLLTPFLLRGQSAAAQEVWVNNPRSKGSQVIPMLAKSLRSPDLLVALQKILAVFLISFFLWMAPVQAQELSTVDLSHVTFNSLPAYKEAGSIPSAGDLTADLGYDPGRRWLPGDLPADVFTLGDFQSSFNAERLNLNQIAQLAGLDIANLRIADIPFLQGATLSELLSIVPSLDAFTLQEIPALANIIGGDLGRTLAEVVSLDSVVGELKINDYLGDFSILEIPNLDLTTLSNFSNWQVTAISEVPGLADVELGSLADSMTTFSGVTAKHDVTYGTKEHRVTLTKFSITGSDQDGFEVQCAQERGCSYLELEGPGKMHGAQWIAGGDGPGQQMVKGGRGLLASINNGEEPTGRHPFGKEFKVVLTETTESEGTGEFALYFNVCAKGAFYDLGCTPYFLGPVPMPTLNSKEKGMVITGLLDGKGGATSGIEAPEGWEDLRPETPQEVTDFIRANTPSGFGYGGLCGEGPGGIDYKALADAYKTIESNVDNYDSVGQYTYGGEGGRGQSLWGYALGRYQYMTYRDDIRAIILPKAGGAGFLAKADRGSGVSVADLNKYFPPESQDDFFRRDQENLIQQAIREGFEGDALIGRVGELHNGGTGARIGSKPEYSAKLIAAYKRIIASEGVSECGKATGHLKNPLPGSAFTSPFGPRRHPVTGERGKMHWGQDLGAPYGTPILASDGGVIVYADWSGGYGNYIIIEHQPGLATNYGHLSKYNVKPGQQVSQGDVIGFVGSTGLSSGPHLHFEVRLDGALVNPVPLVDW